MYLLNIYTLVTILHELDEIFLSRFGGNFCLLNNIKILLKKIMPNFLILFKGLGTVYTYRHGEYH